MKIKLSLDMITLLLSRQSKQLILGNLPATIFTCSADCTVSLFLDRHKKSSNWVQIYPNVH